MKINPIITQAFVRQLMTVTEPYRLSLEIANQPVLIDIGPGVFPPSSSWSISSRLVYEQLGDLSGKKVLDVGCGCGIESIAAALLGAKAVDEIDSAEEAVRWSRHNVELNNLGQRIRIWQSNLLMAVPPQPYDLIIANLPIVDYQPGLEIPRAIAQALYDPGWQLHRQLLAEAQKGYLATNGIITLTHANLQSRYSPDPEADFTRLEKLLSGFGYQVAKKIQQEELGYSWVSYCVIRSIDRLT